MATEKETVDKEIIEQCVVEVLMLSAIFRILKKHSKALNRFSSSLNNNIKGGRKTNLLSKSSDKGTFETFGTLILNHCCQCWIYSPRSFEFHRQVATLAEAKLLGMLGTITTANPQPRGLQLANLFVQFTLSVM